MIKVNDKIRLRSFLGASKPNNEVVRGENYGLLIGKTGIVVSIEGEKALVKFDCDIEALGLICHNPITNTLYISMSDLEYL